MGYLVFIGFIAILASLGSALFFMLQKGKADHSRAKSLRMAHSLAFRVGFSILLFAIVLVAWKFGFIQPTGIKPGQ